MSVHWKLAQFSSFTTHSSQFTMFHKGKQFHKEHIQPLGWNVGESGYHYVFKIRHVWISQKLKLLFVLSRKGHLLTSEFLLKLKRAACPRTAIMQCLDNANLSHGIGILCHPHYMGWGAVWIAVVYDQFPVFDRLSYRQESRFTLFLLKKQNLLALKLSSDLMWEISLWNCSD